MDISWNDSGRLACVALVADEVFHIEDSATLPTIGKGEFKMIGGKVSKDRFKYSLYRQIVWAYRFLKCWIIRKKFPSAGYVAKTNSIFEFNTISQSIDESTDTTIKSSHASKVTRLILLFKLLRENVTKKSTQADIYKFMHNHTLTEAQFEFCGGKQELSSTADKTFIKQFGYMLLDLISFFKSGKFPPPQVLQKATRVLMIPEYDIRSHQPEDDNEEVDNLDGGDLWTDASAVYTEDAQEDMEVFEDDE
jgi:hypothetical protein